MLHSQMNVPFVFKRHMTGDIYLKCLLNELLELLQDVLLEK
jgi:hypothetical protein